MNRQKAALAVLLAFFACSLVYSFIRMPKQRRVEKLTYMPGMVAQPKKSAQNENADSVRVRLDLLNRTQVTMPTGGKNVFQPVFDSGVKKTSVPLPPPPPPPENKVEPPSPVMVLTPPTPPVDEPTLLQRDMATFTFLGFIKKANKKTIFLSNGNEIFLVKKGDKISGRYDVTALTDESLTISSLLDGGEIVLPLVENKPLAAPRK